MASDLNLSALEDQLIHASWRLAAVPEDEALPQLRAIIQSCSLPEARTICAAAVAHHRRLAHEHRHTLGHTHDTIITRLEHLPASLPRDRPRWTWTTHIRSP
jgi:hypothetical protein